MLSNPEPVRRDWLAGANHTPYSQALLSSPQRLQSIDSFVGYTGVTPGLIKEILWKKIKKNEKKS
tara:strand:- start:17907 stop:18101 length:195 start_codon:yes stop_codon:yes gene_type:complete